MTNEEKLQESLNSIAEILNQPEIKDYADSIYVQQVEDRFVLGVEEKKEEEPCVTLVQNMLRDFPECKKRLAYVLLEFKYRLEEGIGQKE